MATLKLLNILAKKWWVGGGSNPGAHTTPYNGPPLLSYCERETTPRKIILATSYYKNMEKYGGCLTGRQSD